MDRSRSVLEGRLAGYYIPGPDRIVFYTRSPGRIKEDINLDFKNGQRFPKKEDLIAQPGYVDAERQLFAWMREEIQQAA